MLGSDHVADQHPIDCHRSSIAMHPVAAHASQALKQAAFGIGLIPKSLLCVGFQTAGSLANSS